MKRSDINFKNGDPIFILKLTGTDYAGKSHTYYRQVRFDAATVKKNTGFIVILILLIEKASIQSVISSLLMVVIIVFTIRIPRLRLIRNPS